MTDTAGPAQAVVEALGTAWTIYGLYPDPEQQDAFGRSLEAVRSAIAGSLTLEVGPGHFLVEGEVVETDREGADRLARQCYLHQIETIRISPPLRSTDLTAWFKTINREEEPVRAAGGVDAALKRDAVTGISVVQRPLLRERPVPIERPLSVQEVIEEDDPAKFAAQLVAAAEGGSLADTFRTRYLAVLSEVAEEDVLGREEVVRSFVEAFFQFDEEQQVELFASLLEHRDDPAVQMIIDQFAGHELAQMAPRLNASALAMLMDYAQITSDQADRRPEELAALLRSPEALDTARSTIAARIQERIGDVAEAVEAIGDSFDSIRTQMPEVDRLFFDALGGFRALLHVEQREARFHRLLRIWTGKITAAVRSGEFRRAELWLHAATDNPTYALERRDDVDAALNQLARSDVSKMLVEAAIDDDPELAFRLLLALGPGAVSVLIDLLAEEEDASRRRVMLDGLTLAATRDPTPIVRRLADAPWYLARNLAGPLGRSHHPEVEEPLAELLTHGDHRVRLEATRSLVTLLGDDAAPYLQRALEDNSAVVRQAAAGLLAGRGTADAQRVLVEALRSSRLDSAEKERIVRLLGDNLTPEAAEALQRLAAQRLVLSSSGRSLRAAAQEALRRRDS